MLSRCELASLPVNFCMRLQHYKAHTTVVNSLFLIHDPLFLFKVLSVYLNTITSIQSQYKVNINSSVNRYIIGY